MTTTLLILSALILMFVCYCIGFADGVGPPPKGKKWPEIT